MSGDLEGCCRYSTSKAGMEGLDKATIMNIILENSKGEFCRMHITVHLTICQKFSAFIKWN